MVLAILQGRKTQTRRVVKYEHYHGCFTGDCPHGSQTECNDSLREYGLNECPYGFPGDRLWVKETYWAFDKPTSDMFGPNPIHYRANYAFNPKGDKEAGIVWRPSIFMPRWASRITLEITDVRVQQLQEISEKDAQAEGILVERVITGVECYGGPPIESYGDRAFYEGGSDEGYSDAAEAYSHLWDDINGKTNPWESNPWVWAITFRRAS